jgi:hypothetical protein
MIPIPRLFYSVLFCLALGSSAWGASVGTIQGDIKGPDRKPVKNAEVRIVPKDGKGAATSVKTDSQGHYIAKGLALNTYTVTASASGMAATSLTGVKPRQEGAVAVNFDLKHQTGAAQTADSGKKKKATHMVWKAASTTGSNLGGRWVEIDDATGEEVTPDSSRVKQVSGEKIRSSGH